MSRLKIIAVGKMHSFPKTFSFRVLQTTSKGFQTVSSPPVPNKVAPVFSPMWEPTPTRQQRVSHSRPTRDLPLPFPLACTSETVKLWNIICIWLDSLTPLPPQSSFTSHTQRQLHKHKLSIPTNTQKRRRRKNSLCVSEMAPLLLFSILFTFLLSLTPGFSTNPEGILNPF